ncbi:MAG: hypothetical protein ABW023_00750 [Sphingomonas sp.]
MIRAWQQVFAQAARFALLCPLLFLVPLVAELVQHWAEVHVGMYDSLAMAKAVEHDPLRMGIGHIKVFALFLIGYWAMRFFAFGNDTTEATRWDGRAVRLFAGVVAWGLFWLVVIQDGPMLATALGVPERPLAFAALGLVLFSMFFETCLSPWKAAAAVGNARIGFFRSIAMIRGSFWWATALLLLTVLPLLVLHYVLAFVAIGKAGAALWAVLAIDSLLTSYLGVVMIAQTWIVAERGARRHGEQLLPNSSA